MSSGGRPGQAHQQRHRAGRMPGGGQQDQAAVTEQVVTRPERRQAGVADSSGSIRCQRKPGRSMWRRISPRISGSGRDSVSHSAWLTTRLAWLSSARPPMWSWWRWERTAVLDIARGVAEPAQPGGQGLGRADREPGQTAVQHPGHAAGEIAGVGDRGPVLPGIEQHQAVTVLDDVGVDGSGPGPASGGEQPPGRRPPGRRQVVRADLHLAGAHCRHPADRVG